MISYWYPIEFLLISYSFMNGHFTILSPSRSSFHNYQPASELLYIIVNPENDLRKISMSFSGWLLYIVSFKGARAAKTTYTKIVTPFELVK